MRHLREEQQQASHAAATFAQRSKPGTQQPIQPEVASRRDPEHGNREQHHEYVAPLPLVRSVGQSEHQLGGLADRDQRAQAAEESQAQAQEDPGLSAPDHVPEPADVGLYDVVDEYAVQLCRPAYRNVYLGAGIRPYDVGLKQFVRVVRDGGLFLDKEAQTTFRKVVPATEVGRHLPPELREEEVAQSDARYRDGDHGDSPLQTRRGVNTLPRPLRIPAVSRAHLSHFDTPFRGVLMSGPLLRRCLDPPSSSTG